MRNRTLHLHMRAGKVFPNYLRPIAVALLLLCSLLSQAQAPQQFSFQGVARDAAGKIVANSNVKLHVAIHKKTPSGNTVFEEEHSVVTNSIGIFNIAIGSAGGDLTAVDWKSDLYFLQVEIDSDGGNNFVDLGSTQLLSVPFALHAEEASRLQNDDPIVLKGDLGSGAQLVNSGAGARMIWYPRKAALRIGHFGAATYLDDSKIGINSFALGYNSSAEANYSITIGRDVIATGVSSFAFGDAAQAQGSYSFALGKSVIAKVFSGLVVGAYNDVSDNPIGIGANQNDRIFQIGNGSGDISRSNAMTVLRTGEIGIGNNVLTPYYLLDIGGRVRLKHKGSETAGIYLDASQKSAEGFVGMKKDNEIGLFISGGWRFWVNDLGNGYLNGSLIQTSDRRLKTNIKPFKSSLGKVNSLQGYHYNWEDKTKDQTLQTGLIAQEVEQVFPELVSTNKDGFKSVNYIGLVPHLIESVKELKSKTDEIAVLRKELEGMREMGKRLELLEASINSGANSRTTKSAAK
ncbi:tail fiber domain-containing protein [Dyadobacter sp. CY351]|uniref:tail fiber domain-containing protein n=1 Tax=Dyadobacter sp. CY351 TaxID=2909337 RepID=UPI001F2AEAD2|nr:tail fiber domain-containing protein [Dyadobacter sp. CY351]MCF2520806.1 tail fiber domain-containing protein [Dyadobacter sp. CY351]